MFNEKTDKNITAISVPMLGASVAAVIDRLVLHPLDTVISWQQASLKNISMMRAAKQIVSHYGMIGLYRGLSMPLFLGAVPIHLSTYGAYRATDNLLKDHMDSHTMRRLTASIVTSLFCAVVITPFDNKRTVETVSKTGQYVPFMGRDMRNMYRGFVPMFTKALVHMPVALFGTDLIKPLLPMNESSSYFLSGIISGALAQVLTTPVDTIKTRVMTDEKGSDRLMHHIKVSISSRNLWSSVPTRAVRLGANTGLVFASMHGVKRLYDQESEAFKPRP